MEALPKQLHIDADEGITNPSQPTDRVSDPGSSTHFSV
jgi:hypothetical protein